MRAVRNQVGGEVGRGAVRCVWVRGGGDRTKEGPQPGVPTAIIACSAQSDGCTDNAIQLYATAVVRAAADAPKALSLYPSPLSLPPVSPFTPSDLCLTPALSPPPPRRGCAGAAGCTAESPVHSGGHSGGDCRGRIRFRIRSSSSRQEWSQGGGGSGANCGTCACCCGGRRRA